MEQKCGLFWIGLKSTILSTSLPTTNLIKHQFLSEKEQQIYPIHFDNFLQTILVINITGIEYSHSFCPSPPNIQQYS